LIAIDPMLNPLRATTNISAAMVGSSLIAPRRDKEEAIVDYLSQSQPL
jgi:hypothetical protein